MVNPSDEVLIEKAKAGDMEAFRSLVVRHEGRVAGIVRSLLGATPLAEDIGQEVFLSFYDSLDKYREHITVDRYLTKISLKLSIHELKRRTKSRGHVSREALERVNGPNELIGMNELLQQEFSMLDAEAQAVVTLRLIEGFSIEETAELLGISANTVLARLADAQYSLRNALSEKLSQ